MSTLARHTGQAIADDAKTAWRWEGRPVRLVDGTTVAMPDTVANQAAYPQPRSQQSGLGFPLCRLAALICLSSGAVLNAAISRYQGKGADEQTLLRSMLDRLNAGDILLGDALFATYFLLCELQRRGVDGLFEQYGAGRCSTDFRRGHRLGTRDHIIQISKPKLRPPWMSRTQYDAAPASLSVRELRVGGKTLVTTIRLFRSEPSLDARHTFGKSGREHSSQEWLMSISTAIKQRGARHAMALGMCLLSLVLLTGATPLPAPSADVLAARQILDAYSGRADVLPVARERITRALKAKPNDYLALKELSRYHVISGFINSTTYQPGSLEEAEAAIREALRIAPEFPEGHIFLGHIQLQHGNLDEALASLLHAAELGTMDPSLDLNLARVYAGQGELARNLEHSQRVLDNPAATPNQKSNAAWYLAQGDQRAGEVGAGASRFEEQVRLNPTNAWVRGDYANYLSETLGRHDEAIAEARKALEILDHGVGRHFLAMALYRKWAELVADGKAEEGEKFFVEAQQNYPPLDWVMAEGASVSGGEQFAHALMTQKGVSIDAENERGSTALLIATKNERVDVVKRLLDLGADPNISSARAMLPLVYAAQDGNAEIVEILLAKTQHTVTRPAMQAAAHAKSGGHAELAARLRTWDETAHSKWLSMRRQKK